MARLALGSAQFGLPYGISNENGIVPPELLSEILIYCQRVGISVVDTAAAYGDAERNLGKQGVDDFKVVSKFYGVSNQLEFESRLKETLKNLRLKQLYGYLAHRPTELIENVWQWDLLLKKKEEGQVGKIGYSLNFPDELHRLLDRGFTPDLVQLPFNYLDRRFEEDIRSLKELDVEVHARSAFMQGLFFSEPNSLPAFFDPVKPFLTMFQEDTASLVGTLLKFVLENKSIDKVVIGVETPQHLQEIVESIPIARSSTLPIPSLSDRILSPVNWPNLG